jgi:Tfp pilus assembly protein FimT
MLLYSSKNTQGSSLVELLIVLMLATLIISVVAPNFFTLLKSHDIRLENQKFSSVIQSAKKKTFLTGKNVQLLLEQNQLEILVGDKIKKQLLFKYLEFEKQTINFSQDNWFIAIKQIEIVIGDEKISYDISSSEWL